MSILTTVAIWMTFMMTFIQTMVWLSMWSFWKVLTEDEK